MLCVIPFYAYLSDASTGEVTVSAAISLKDAFEEIAKIYEGKGGSAKVLFNFGASGDLARKIKGGAHVDVFASAAQDDMDDLDIKGLILRDTRSNFAANSIVLIVPAGSKIVLASFQGLAAKEIKKIAVGNPKFVPAGSYAEEVLKYYKLLPSVKDLPPLKGKFLPSEKDQRPPSVEDKLIFTENVRQALDYVVRAKVDAGIVYATDALTSAKEVRIAASAPDKTHMPVVYPIAALRETNNEASARAFVELVLSPEGQRILEKYGFKKY